MRQFSLFTNPFNVKWNLSLKMMLCEKPPSGSHNSWTEVLYWFYVRRILIFSIFLIENCNYQWLKIKQHLTQTQNTHLFFNHLYLLFSLVIPLISLILFQLLYYLDHSLFGLPTILSNNCENDFYAFSEGPTFYVCTFRFF